MMKDLLIVGCGDIARRALPRLKHHFRVTALARLSEAARRVHEMGAAAIAGDLDDPATLRGLGAGATHILHCAPPGNSAAIDQRTRNLIAALENPMPTATKASTRFVYLSTSGVYGDCAGAWVDESRPRSPASTRARRRVDAEEVLENWAARRGVSLAILRVPGIYAADRLPLARLRAGTPALRFEDDVYTNHIHAEDLAAIVEVALLNDAARGVFNSSDDTEMKMGDYFDLVAKRHHLPPPPRIARASADGVIPPQLLSFMSESRRLVNAKMKRELGVQLMFPTVREGVPEAAVAD